MFKQVVLTYLLSDLRVLALVEAFWGLVPVGSHTLTRQFDFVLIFFDDLTQAEICDFDFSIVEYYVLWLEIIMDNFLLLVVQVLQAGQDL